MTDKKISQNKQWEEYFYDEIIKGKFPKPEREYKFLDKRKFRLDYAWPNIKLGAECHGGVYSRGGHVTGGGYTKDREKMNLALINGWRVLEFTTQQINSGQAIEWLQAYWDKQVTKND